MEREDIVRRTWELLEPELAEQGFELVEAEYGQRGATHILRLFIDRDGGVNMNHCVEVTHFVGPLLDRFDYIQGEYSLEVSSPGFDRPIRKPADFERFRGERIKLKTIVPVNGRKRFTGTLQGFEDGLITIEVDNEHYRVHIENLKKANLDR